MEALKLISYIIDIATAMFIMIGIVVLGFYAPYRVIMSFVRPDEGFFEFWIWFTVTVLIWSKVADA